MLRLDDHGRVRLLTFDRPEARNAFNDALYKACGDALDAAAEAPGVAVVVITGAGPAFSAGQDLAEMQAIDPDDATADHGFPGFLDTLSSFPKPIVGAVNGAAVGVGTTMLPFFEVVVAGRSARFRVPFANLGVAPEAASSVTLPALMGWRAAARFLLTGDWLDSQSALAAGLVSEVVPDEQVVDRALEIATAVAAGPIPSLVEIKGLLVAGRAEAIAAARSREDAAFGRLLGGPAFVEAATAFLEGRKPDFSAIDGA